MTNPTPAASGAAPDLPTDAMIHAAAHAFDVSNATFLVKMRCALSAALARQEAAPAKDGYATAFYEIASVLGIGARADTPENVFRNEMLPRIVALASREASPAALTDEPTVPEDVLVLVRKYGDARADDMGWAQATVDLVHGLRRWAAALASPQVAPAPEPTLTETRLRALSDRAWESWNASPDAFPSFAMCLARLILEDLATPVQVAPTETAILQMSEWFKGHEFANVDEMQGAWEALEKLKSLVASPVAPQDDARDAARYRKLRAQSWHASDLFVVAGGKSSVRLGIDCPRTDRLDEAVDALPTPAAKPTEPTLPTQAEQSHD